MTDLKDSRYYEDRAAKALMLAENASNPAIAKIHYDMAESYRRLGRLKADPKPTLRIAE